MSLNSVAGTCIAVVELVNLKMPKAFRRQLQEFEWFLDYR